ncbi:hypothetical protein PA35_06550 [Pseudomonas aeruginosa]|nr:hypothetical protein PA35_06550 [Pseudomonas aeruginosa]RCN17186.1 hypothetical protein PA32_06520 [Pseudomonas aeruginosa]
MRSGAAARREDAGDPLGVEAGDIGGADLVHHQDVRLLRLARRLHPAEPGQHPPAEVAEVGGALGEQRVVQRLLLRRAVFHHPTPGRFGAFAAIQAQLHLLGQFRIVEHLPVGDENLADRLHRAAFDQADDLLVHRPLGPQQALAFMGRRLATRLELEALRHLDMRRTTGDARRRGDRLQALAGAQRRRPGILFRLADGIGQGLLRQRFDLLAEPLAHRGQQGWQRVLGDRRLGAELQRLAASRAEGEQLAQALRRDGGRLAVGQAYPDLAGEALGQLRQRLRRAGMQAMRVGQDRSRAGPVRRQLATERREYAAAAGGAHQLGATPFQQQVAQAFEQRLVRFAQAGQAEQPGDRLTLVLQRLRRSDEGQPGALHQLFAVQPAQPVAQRQRFGLLEHGGEAVLHAAGLLQQARAEPGQFVEVLGVLAEADQLCVQRQFLRRALQQAEDFLGAGGRAQRRSQVGLAEGAGEQLQELQVFVGLRRDADGQVDLLAIAPVHSLGELQQAHTGAEDQLAGIRGPMGYGDALAEVGGALCLARLQALGIAGRGQAVGDQRRAEQAQGFGLVRGALAHADLPGIEFEHGNLLRSERLPVSRPDRPAAPRRGRGMCRR